MQFTIRLIESSANPGVVTAVAVGTDVSASGADAAEAKTKITEALQKFLAGGMATPPPEITSDTLETIEVEAVPAPAPAPPA